jgi:BirA family transcriptional regulator, biotin operon repressor / biotin---[acetyl-CoA-carboxylase] ligase
MSQGSKKIIILHSVDSTNNYAMGMVKKGTASNGNTVFAMEQTRGKGRRGKRWDTIVGENITMSIVAEMQWLPVSQQFQLSVAVALACHDFFSRHTSESVRIKWPNDIFINDSKAGGILIENLIQGHLWQWSVIGLGMNINQVQFEAYGLPPVSLKQITGKKYDVLQMAEELCILVLNRIDDLKKNNFLKMLEEYNGKLFAKDRLVTLKKQNIVFQTTITGVSASGQLITQDVLERKFNFDEVEFKGIV